MAAITDEGSLEFQEVKFDWVLPDFMKWAERIQFRHGPGFEFGKNLSFGLSCHPPNKLAPHKGEASIISNKYERILLLARRILVMRISIFKYHVFWLGLFSVF